MANISTHKHLKIVLNMCNDVISHNTWVKRIDTLNVRQRASPQMIFFSVEFYIKNYRPFQSDLIKNSEIKDLITVVISKKKMHARNPSSTSFRKLRQHVHTWNI